MVMMSQTLKLMWMQQVEEKPVDDVVLVQKLQAQQHAGRIKPDVRMTRTN